MQYTPQFVLSLNWGLTGLHSLELAGLAYRLTPCSCVRWKTRIQKCQSGHDPHYISLGLLR